MARTFGKSYTPLWGKIKSTVCDDSLTTLENMKDYIKMARANINKEIVRKSLL